jgi:hypothetical protein
LVIEVTVPRKHEGLLSLSVATQDRWRAITAPHANHTSRSTGAAVFGGDTYDADYHGPSDVGIRSFLIDPPRQAAIPEEARLTSIFELPARMAVLN